MFKWNWLASHSGWDYMYNVIDCLVYMYVYVLVSFSDCHQLFSMRDLWMCHSILVENKFLSWKWDFQTLHHYLCVLPYCQYGKQLKVLGFQWVEHPGPQWATNSNLKSTTIPSPTPISIHLGIGSPHENIKLALYDTVCEVMFGLLKCCFGITAVPWN